MKISLKFKITFFIVMLVLVMMGTVTYIFTIREIKLRIQQVELRMERLANNIATIRSVETEDWDVYQTYIDNQIRLNPDIVYIAIFDERNELRVHTLNTDWIEIDTSRTLDRWEQASIVWRLDQRQIAEESQRDLEAKSVNILIGGENVGTVKVGFSLVELNDEMLNNLYRNLTLAVIFIALAITISLLMSRKIVNPLGKLTRAMLRISEGDMEQELHLASRDEIGEMAKTFNFMTKGLREKKAMEDFARDLSITIELEKTANLITEYITLALNADHAMLLLKDTNKTGRFTPVSQYPKLLIEKTRLNFPTSLIDHFLKTPNPTTPHRMTKHRDIASQLKFLKEFDDNSLLAPVIIQKDLIGFFILSGCKSHNPYTDEESKFLQTLVSQASFAIENALLLEELTEQERLKRELEIARTIQHSLLPKQNPQFSELDIDGICIPTQEVGGDYFDYFYLDHHKLGITIADVTGKGTSAAFYMAVVKGMMLSLTSVYTSPKQLLIELNRQLFGIIDRKMFVTMTYAVVDTREKTLHLSRAGHNALIMRDTDKSTIECLTPSGIGLGLEAGQKFETTISEQRMRFKQGDIFLFYTDGVSEAMNGRREEYGEERLVDLLNRVNSQSARGIRESIIHTVNEFVQDAPQHDDITIVILKAT